ncbi:hypothetical protein C8A05DRAFT_19563, partial [Staphylotrichum tortipilum]
ATMTTRQTPTPPLFPIWLHLPNDLTQLILSHLVAAHFHTDPAYTWTRLRHVSAHQKRTIERRFAREWLPRLGITLYGGARHKVEYRLDDGDGSGGGQGGQGLGGDGFVTFVVDRHLHQPVEGFTRSGRPGRLTGEYIRGVWGEYDAVENRNVTVRLGEGVLNGGCRGGYILNDTGLPGLEVLQGERIRFCWRGAVDELLREEMYLRKVGEEMVIKAPPPPPPPHLGIWLTWFV